MARRAAQTAAGIGTETGLVPFEFEGIHEVQVGELEDRSDDAAVAEFNRIYERWHLGELDVPMPGGESAEEVLGRYVPVLTELRLRYLDDQDFHSDIVAGEPWRRDPAGGRRAGRRRRQLRPRPPPGQHRIGCAGADHRRALELCAMGGGDTAVLSGARL